MAAKIIVLYQKLFLFLLTVTHVFCGRRMKRIVGGHDITIQDVPYMVSIQILFAEKEANCGGSLLTPSWVLTAAHCINTESETTYNCATGSTYSTIGGQRRSVTHIITHELFNKTTKFDYDVALLKMNHEFSLDPHVKLIKLANITAKIPQQLFIAGWGKRSEHSEWGKENLNGVTVELVDWQKCKEKFQSLKFLKVTGNMFCAYKTGADACTGDSGGPAVQMTKLGEEAIQYGIISFGYGCANNYPGVYTDIRIVRDWILNKIKGPL